jgi:Flp pilus assembly pilin Flp
VAGLPLGDAYRSGVKKRMAIDVQTFARQFVADESGQDLLEYALLSLFIGLAGLAALNSISAAIGTYYSSSNTTVNGLWNSPTPTGS